MEEMISRAEHEEFCRRLDAENCRQNARLDELEATVVQINSLTVSVEKLAVNMDSMVRELTEQNSRLREIESQAGANWRKVVGSVITGIVGALVGVLMVKMGLS